MPRDPKPNLGWEQVQQNPTYFPASLTDTEGANIHWHSPTSPHSSQIICISTFGGIRSLAECDMLCDCFFSTALAPGISRGQWRIELEKKAPEVLNEHGGNCSNIDALCQTDSAVVVIEAKFKTDARRGFGRCGQLRNDPKNGYPKCSGSYLSGSDLSDKTRSASPCRLTIADGNRTARNYWQLGVEFFKPEVQVTGHRCPFADGNFQLMRNFLFAAKTARATKRAFAFVVVVPDGNSKRIRQEVNDFQGILKFQWRNRVSILTYESILKSLERLRGEDARVFTEHLRNMLAAA